MSCPRCDATLGFIVSESGQLTECPCHSPRWIPEPATVNGKPFDMFSMQLEAEADDE